MYLTVSRKRVFFFTNSNNSLLNQNRFQNRFAPIFQLLKTLKPIAFNSVALFNQFMYSPLSGNKTIFLFLIGFSNSD